MIEHMRIEERAWMNAQIEPYTGPASENAREDVLSTLTALQDHLALAARLNGEAALERRRETMDAKMLGWFVGVPHALRETIPQLIEAAERGDTWAAVHAALRVGMLEAYFDELAVEYELHEAQPAIATGRKVRAAKDAGGRATAERFAAERPDDDTLCADVLAIHRRNVRVSWTQACKIVGERIGRSGKTVQRRTRSIRW